MIDFLVDAPSVFVFLFVLWGMGFRKLSEICNVHGTTFIYGYVVAIAQSMRRGVGTIVVACFSTERHI